MVVLINPQAPNQGEGLEAQVKTLVQALNDRAEDLRDQVATAESRLSYAQARYDGSVSNHTERQLRIESINTEIRNTKKQFYELSKRAFNHNQQRNALHTLRNAQSQEVLPELRDAIKAYEDRYTLDVSELNELKKSLHKNYIRKIIESNLAEKVEVQVLQGKEAVGSAENDVKEAVEKMSQAAGFDTFAKILRVGPEGIRELGKEFPDLAISISRLLEGVGEADVGEDGDEV